MLKQLKLCSIAFLRLQLNEMENFNCSLCMCVYGCGCVSERVRIDGQQRMEIHFIAKVSSRQDKNIVFIVIEN